MNINFARFSPLTIAAAALLGSACFGLQAQSLPLTTDAASPVEQPGIPVTDLAPNAPDIYTVKSGDTLWSIAGVFLKSPWRWPDLWGMNRQQVRDPHWIYPGQQLMLEKSNGRARLRTGRSAADGRSATASRSGPPSQTLRVSPRTRFSSLNDSAIPTLAAQIIEPFLSEPLIVNEQEFAIAPRIVATQESRVLLSRGDRAYASGDYVANNGKPLSTEDGQPRDFRVFRNATPLKDPTTQAILGYEAQYVGQAELVRGESTTEVQDESGKLHTEKVPATIDIVSSKEEMRMGDRLLPEPPRELRSYVPRAPASALSGQIVSVYGNAVALAGNNQIVVLNRGSSEGLERGHVMALWKDGARLQDKTDDARPQLKLPNERNGVLMVFRTFEHLSYALILQMNEPAKVGDRFTNPN